MGEQSVLKLHHLRPAPGAKTAKTRVGRGEGSKGKTAGRGTKGTGARKNVPARFEGGQMPLHMRLPKLKGFKNPFKVEFQVVNLDRIGELFPDGGEVGAGLAGREGRRARRPAGQGPGQRGDRLGGAGERARVLRVRQGEDRRCRGLDHRALTTTHLSGARTAPARSRSSACGPLLGFLGPAAPARGLKRGLGARRIRQRLPDAGPARKLLFVVFIIAIFRFGSQLPSPGVDVGNVRQCVDQVSNSGVYGLINLFSGGALLQLTVFALGIMPYITASIILQLLVVVIPRLETLKKEGQAGQAKITQYTRYLTLALAILQATGIVALARAGQLLQGCNLPLLYDDGIQTMLVMVVTMTAGTAVIMWFGELITDRGIGNGMSILIFTQVVATFPATMWSLQQTKGWAIFAMVIVDRHGDHRDRHLHGAGPTQDPRAVRPTDGRAEDVRRLLDVHPAQGQPGRHHPGHLRLEPALPPCAVHAVRPGRQQPDHELDRRLPRARRPPALHGAVLRPHRLLHLLLRRDHVQPSGDRRQHEEVRRLHPRDPGGQADRGVPQLRPVPHHACRARSTSA